MLTLLALSTTNSQLSTLYAQGTAFTYNGRLTDGASPANGTYDLRFSLFDAGTNGVQFGNTLTNAVVAVSAGLFTVELDFGSNFPGADRWLEIGARTNGGGTFTTLNPRQRITAAPYAITAGEVTGVNIARLDANQAFSGTVNFSSMSNNFAGSFTGNGGGLTNVPGAIPTQTVVGTSVQAQPGTAYVANNTVQVSVNLPASPNFGDVIQVQGLGSGGWRVEPAAGQYINGRVGLTWVPRESSRAWKSVASSADGTKLVAVVESGGQIYTSSNGGTNWTARESNRNWWYVASSADGTRLVAAVGNGQIYTSTDSGMNWFPRESNRNWFSVGSSADGTKLVAVVAAGRIYTSTDSGANWAAHESNRNWWSVASSADGGKLVASDYSRLYTSTDGGTNWVQGTISGQWQAVASSADGSKLVAVTYNSPGKIYTSSDGGTNWVERLQSSYFTSVASSADGVKLVATSVFGIYLSSNSGTNWFRQATIGPSAMASSADGTRLVAVDYLGLVYTSTPEPLTGPQGATVQLQYAGNGVWQPLNLAQSAAAPNTIVARDANGTITATSFVGDGSGLTNINAGNIVSGIFDPKLSDSVLSGNVALLNRSPQTFTGTNVFSDRVGIGTSSPATALDVNGTATASQFLAPDGLVGAASYAFQGDPNTGLFHPLGNTLAFTTTGAERMRIEGAGNVGIGTNNPSQKLHVIGNILATGTITPNSDRNAKTDFVPVDRTAILERVSKLDIQQWRFKAEAVAVKHIGPMAQDFRALFGLGEIPTAIATVDADGVALAAIQGLNQKLTEELTRRDAENSELKRRLDKLERLVTQKAGGRK